MLGFSPAAWTSGGIVLLLSERAAAYEEVAEAFAARLGDTRGLRILYADGVDGRELSTQAREPGLLVPVGLRATRMVAEHVGRQAAVLALMVPRSAYEAIVWPAALSRRRLSAVFIDQPPGRSLDLIERVLPRARSIGVIHSESAAGLSSLQQEAARRRLHLRSASIAHTGEVGAALRQLLPEIDVLLLLPDAQVVHANNVQHVLLTTYRYRVPVIGFSQVLVKAGAIAAIYSTPAQIGAQGGEIARQWRAGDGELPAPGHCESYSIGFNHHVARSLGIVLPDEARVRQLMGAEP
ncbi:MAG: hypothetical protein N2Z63_10210 [Thiobacillaceae bacterium]|nr:hypothetical protein [Thiobacillaceae bacterium]